MAKAIFPAPVYEAHFADNTVARMSFWQASGKPYDFARGRKLLAQAYGLPIVNGFVEHDMAGKPWLRERDPAFMPQAAVAMPRPSYKAIVAQAREALAQGKLNQLAALLAA